MNQENNTQPEYDEIDLMDYLKVVIKRKRLILIIFLVAVIVAGVFNYFAPKIYKIDTSLEIGTIGDKVIEEPSQVIGKIDSDAYGILVREKLGISEDEYPKIKTENPENTNLVIITIESSQPDLAKNILREINNLILAEHQEKLDKEKTKTEESINEIQEELTLLETKKQYSEGIAELQIKISNLKSRINECEPTKIIKSPTVSKNPIKSKLVLNIIIAGVLGLFVGTFLAFGKEWWEKSK